MLTPVVLAVVVLGAQPQPKPQPEPRPTLDLPLGTWVKLSPLETTPTSPRLGYEGACTWDGRNGVLIRYGGHNQGGGGEQGSEVWTFEPVSARWTLKETNVSPPGVCCAQQHVQDPLQGKHLRFPSFSGSHGWQWWREIYLNTTSVWSYDAAANAWRDLNPLPAPSPKGLRCASWDVHHGVVVIFGGENSREGTLVYDPGANTWTRMQPPEEPEFRSGGNMAYDEARRLHILFGAQFSDDRHTWAYDLDRNEWRDMKPDSMPPTDRNDAVLAYDAVARKVVAIVQVTQGEDEDAVHRLETWLYDAGENRWSPLRPPREPDPTGNRARNLVWARELNACLLENRTHPPRGDHEQQVWALRLAGAPAGASAAAGPGPGARPSPGPVGGLVVSTTYGEALLRWASSGIPGATGWAVYRAEGERPWEGSWRKLDGPIEAERGGRGRRASRKPQAGAAVPVEAPRVFRYRDRDVRPGVIYRYRVRPIGPDGAEGPDGPPVAARPGIASAVVVSVLSRTEVEVAWTPPPERDVFRYEVERAPVEVLTEDQLRRLKTHTPPLADPSVGAVTRIGEFDRLGTATGTRFVDTTVDLGRPAPVPEAIHDRPFHEEEVDPAGRPYRFGVFAYRVRATNELGATGGPSPATLTIPSPPHNLFSREDGSTCHLRWDPSPERSIAGYRIYRMDGRWDKDPIPRLTADPIRETRFSDPGAGSDTRRYHVVAVDVLGQEGFPSSPVWFDREWKEFYRPFVGEWHQ